ncbi:DUF6220 domain-containing protein [Paenibacillus ginsengarvi]|uniref:Uncharacterized protein n=1 Tax=Paenibacillus ginsengarvi TaxID=400777 RepID=A0A3B0B4W2_9BACL|nr:DUF6220 domain-containing protein [Paenibacillus ginsengarvi]RKN66036.1 hypothetical protein D7M11_31675 [Paenibacillus ginsengarvi]
MSDPLTTPNRINRIGGIVYTGLAFLFTVCITVQIFIAGMAIFIDASHWREHIVFVRIFELFPLLLLLFAFVGKLPHWFRWMSGVIFLLIYAQYFTAHLPVVGAFHPVIAAVLFGTSVHVSVRSAQYVFPKRQHKEKAKG